MIQELREATRDQASRDRSFTRRHSGRGWEANANHAWEMTCRNNENEMDSGLMRRIIGRLAEQGRDLLLGLAIAVF